ncbi:MAG: ribonuclease H-like domain-containing protein [Clostridia bacterium]|nr:ribonuclease H-like domain-containing protein [Clostridia bacterium]
MTLLDKVRAVGGTAKAPAPAPRTFSDCYVRKETRELDAFPYALSLSRESLMLMQSQDLPDPVDPMRILYLDTETTGLGGGAGTVAFEIGLGQLTPDGFQITQLVMRDYPEEKYMLQRVEDALDNADLLCTFNGKSFDIPLLRTRFLMNRMNPACLDMPHIDLLPLARRIWKLRIRQCTLQRLETEILHMPRMDDLPGSEAPQRYFSYLKTGEFALLEDVLRHNAQDVASMCVLLSHMANLYRAPDDNLPCEDLFSMAKALEKEKHPHKARMLYHKVPQGKLHASSQMRLADIHRREGNQQMSAAIYEHMIQNHEGGVMPYIALAKYKEHTLRDIEGALNLTRQALMLLAEPTLESDTTVQETRFALQYRYERLLKRSGKVCD